MVPNNQNKDKITFNYLHRLIWKIPLLFWIILQGWNVFINKITHCNLEKQWFAEGLKHTKFKLN